MNALYKPVKQAQRLHNGSRYCTRLCRFGGSKIMLSDDT
jgi:hypothetical protein